MKLIQAMLVVAGAIFMFACEQPAHEEPEADPGEVKAQIQELENRYAKASNERNVEDILSIYADDAYSLEPDQPMIKGKAEIRRDLEEEFAADTSGGQVKFDVVEIFHSGDLAVEIGTSTYTSSDGSVEKGKYVAVFEMRDSTWVCVADIWNEDEDDDADEDNDANGEAQGEGDN